MNLKHTVSGKQKTSTALFAVHIKINNTGYKYNVNICTQNFRNIQDQCIARLLSTTTVRLPYSNESSSTIKNCTEQSHHTETNYCTVKREQEHYGCFEDIDISSQL